jgi:hypothetical protein
VSAADAASASGEFFPDRWASAERTEADLWGCVARGCGWAGWSGSVQVQPVRHKGISEKSLIIFYLM